MKLYNLLFHVTPLFIAAKNNYIEIVKYLLSIENIDVNLKSIQNFVCFIEFIIIFFSLHF